MNVAIDFGISNTDIAVSKDSNVDFFTLPSKKIDHSMLDEIFKHLNIDIDACQKDIDELEVLRAGYQNDLEKAQEIFTQNSSERVDGERLAEIKSNHLPNCIKDIANLEEQLTQHAKTSYIGIIDKVAIKTIEKLNSKREALNKKLKKLGAKIKRIN